MNTSSKLRENGTFYRGDIENRRQGKMPKSSKKAGSQKGREQGQSAAQPDFTLAQFADADPAVVGKAGRMKKGSVKLNGKELIGEATDKSNLAWDEKELSDFEIGSGPDEEQSEKNEEGSPRAKVKRKVRVAQFDGGVEYPTDVWFLIGDWITPESIATFSAICQGSHVVVHTVRFWNSLYKRYYQPDVTLPKELQPCYMEKIHGLRTRIVRCLFYLYPPFVQRVKALVPFEQQVDTLEGQLCTLMWYQKVKTTWHFFFKFRRPGRKQCIYTQPDRRDHLWHFVPDIYCNDEEDSSVLQIVMTDFAPLPMAMGYKLRKASVSVGHAMRYHKLRLIFAQGNVGAERVSQDNGVVLVMDPVINVRVLRWFNPSYPCNGPQLTSPPTPS